MASKKRTTEDRRIGAIFASRLREARKARAWTQGRLADELAQLGAPMDRTTLAKIEKGQREVRLEELIALAAALDVAPIYLLFPIKDDVVVFRADEKARGVARYNVGPLVRLAPELEVNQVKARRWAAGEIPLKPENYRFYREQAAADRAPSAEELSPAEQQVLYEENEQLIRKLGDPFGVRLVHETEPAEQASPPGKRKPGRASARREQ